jgi:predicted  nucleic acid-binding Zn-ribbon protein
LQEIAAVESRKKDLEGEVAQLLKDKQCLEQELKARRQQIANSTADTQSLHTEVKRLQKELAAKRAIVSTNESLLREEMQCIRDEVKAKEQLIKDG